MMQTNSNKKNQIKKKNISLLFLEKQFESKNNLHPVLNVSQHQMTNLVLPAHALKNKL